MSWDSISPSHRSSSAATATYPSTASCSSITELHVQPLQRHQVQLAERGRGLDFPVVEVHVVGRSTGRLRNAPPNAVDRNLLRDGVDGVLGVDGHETFNKVP